MRSSLALLQAQCTKLVGFFGFADLDLLTGNVPASIILNACRDALPAAPHSLLMSQLRDFIAHSLYDVRLGYFAKQTPVAFLDPPIDFSALSGKHAYLSEVSRRYAALGTHWLTPAEIFSPHYGAAIGNYLATQHEMQVGEKGREAASAGNGHTGYVCDTTPLKVYEIGGGTGTLAKDVLNWLKITKPNVYETCQYTIIEISRQLADLQCQRLEQAGHGSRFKVVQGDASDAQVWNPCFASSNSVCSSSSADEGDYEMKRHQQARDGGFNSERCFVVAMEVLDNLPHDKVIKPAGRGPTQAQWYEAVVEVDETRDHYPIGKQQTPPLCRERYRPVSDSIIERCLDVYLEGIDSGALEIYPANQRSNVIASKVRSLMKTMVDFAFQGQSVFMPTGALHFFDTLHAVRPRHRLLAMDFDYLPDTQIAGVHAPLVSSGSCDHATYLLPAGTADIFFPSNFQFIRELYLESRAQVLGKGDSGSVQVHKAGAFLERWAPDGGHAASTESGYCPMLEDYSNTSALIS